MSWQITECPVAHLKLRHKSAAGHHLFRPKNILRRMSSLQIMKSSQVASIPVSSIQLSVVSTSFSVVNKFDTSHFAKEMIIRQPLSNLF